jgi:hypothetical protein
LRPLALIALALLLQTLAHRNPQLVERFYSRRIFPAIGRTLSLINDLFGFSIAEMMSYVLAAAILIVLISQAGQIYLRRRRFGRLARTDLLVLLWIIGSGLILFLIAWGLNYQRVPLRSRFDGSSRSVSNEQLKKIGETIVNEINSNYDQRHNIQAGYAPPSRAQVYELIESSYQREPLLGETNGRFGSAKPIYSSGVMSRLGLSGFYMPFTGEPNFNADQPDFDLPYVIAHEKAHQRGFAREDEANFLSFVVCTKSTDPFVRYSGYLNALKVVGSFVASDPDYYRGLLARVGEGPRNDLRARAAFWGRYQGTARVLAGKVNNSYLKANRIGSGLESYEEDVALIVAYYLTKADQANK